MGFRLAVLILIPCVLLSSAGLVPASESACLDCHSAHYEAEGTCTQCHRGDSRTTRKSIAHHGLIPGRFAHFNLDHSEIAKRGLQGLKDAGCRRCHVSGGKGNRLASDLDRVSQTSDSEELVKSITEPAIFMPDFHFSESQVVELVNGLFAGMKQVPPDTGEVPRVVHFTGLKEAEEHVFSKHCGGCHRLMSQKLGGSGEGEVGPNLSGLFTEFYPRNFREDERWGRENLEKWLKNPREIRPNAGMIPVRMKEEERDDLLRFFQSEAEQ
ncbi:MAG: selenite/tellurite reduction operon c-type cytochrome lipoprotein ExtS [Desulfuromonadales bacterium]